VPEDVRCAWTLISTDCNELFSYTCSRFVHFQAKAPPTVRHVVHQRKTVPTQSVVLFGQQNLKSARQQLTIPKPSCKDLGGRRSGTLRPYPACGTFSAGTVVGAGTVARQLFAIATPHPMWCLTGSVMPAPLFPCRSGGRRMYVENIESPSIAFFCRPSAW